VQTFTSEFIDAARAARHATGDRWLVDETYVKVAGRWTLLYRAVDQHGQVIDVLVSERRDRASLRAARKVRRPTDRQLTAEFDRSFLSGSFHGAR
jgi:transposase-like protein